MAVHDINRNRSGTEAEAQLREEARSVRSLFSELGNEISTLFRQEVALMKAETGEKINQAKSGAISMAAGAGIAFMAGIILLMAAVYGLSELMHPGWAALIVGGVTLIAGLIMLNSGRRNLKTGNMMPHRTAESLKRDANVAARRTHE